MKSVTTIIACALALTLVGLAPAPAEAVGLGCGTPARTATVFSTAGSGEGVGWAPDCVTLMSSFAQPASVTFTNLDPIFHKPVAKGCFNEFQVNAGQSKSLENLRLVNGKVLVGFTPCDETATQARVGTFIPRTEGPKEPVIEYGVDGPGTATVHFICSIHGAAMHGRIVLTPA